MKKLLALLAFLFLASAAQAQFADQRQYVGSTGGSANVQTAAAIPRAMSTPLRAGARAATGAGLGAAGAAERGAAGAAAVARGAAGI